MEAKDELHSKLKKPHHREIIVCQHSRGGGSNATLVAVGWGTGEQRQEGQPAHRPTYPHLRTNSKAQTPRLQQKRWLLLFRKASSIPCHVCVFVPFCVTILIAPRAVCGCSTSSLLSREACTAWQDVCVQLCVRTVVVLPTYVYVAATLLFYVPVSVVPLFV